VDDHLGAEAADRGKLDIGSRFRQVHGRRDGECGGGVGDGQSVVTARAVTTPRFFCSR